jgi:formate dehydrogenase iron-sulfur subunit
VRFVESPGGHLPDIPAVGGGRDDVDLVAWAESNVDKWAFMSDVCKHCTNAGCLDACPTGALIRTEFETVIVQPDVCNGCGYCIPSCPFGVIDRDPYDGRAAKCTLCYDRLHDGLEPACAKACPTDSIQFGPYEELVEVAKGRVIELHERGLEGAYLYGAADGDDERLAGGLGAFFLLTQPPERFGLPANAESPIQENGPHATAAGLTAALVAAAGTVASFALAHRRR